MSGKRESSSTLFMALCSVVSLAVLISVRDPVALIINVFAIIILLVAAIARAVVTKKKSDLAKFKQSCLIVAILVIPFASMVACERFQLLDRIDLTLFPDRYEHCASLGVQFDSWKKLAVCKRQDLERWAEIETVIYDDSDQIALHQGSQSKSWLAAAIALRLPVNQLAFSAIPIGRHIYRVDFDENHTAFLTSK